MLSSQPSGYCFFLVFFLCSAILGSGLQALWFVQDLAKARQQQEIAELTVSSGRICGVLCLCDELEDFVRQRQADDASSTFEL
jgi:hypothetical protein